MKQGFISSVENMGLVDGPGLRYVVFMQGCSLRCLYCHNPETWKFNCGRKMTAEELVTDILKYKNYYLNGGVTFSGGEPLMQPEFLIECLKLCKENNLHTAIDTAGVGIKNFDEILKYTDLVILDIKAIDEKMYHKVTGGNIKNFEKFLCYLNKSNTKVWIRSVIVPGINDTREYILNLNKYIEEISNVEKVELLPYHLYGVDKYKNLELEYPLKDIEPLKKEKLKELENYLNKKSSF